MRVFFFTLLLLNVALFGYFHTRDQGGRTGAAPHSQLNPERVRMASESAPANAKTTKTACYAWQGIAAERMADAEQALAKFNLGDRVSRPKTQEFFVHIPPLASAKDAEKKLAELKRLGVADASIVSDAGKWHWAIAFGTHPTEQEAVVHLNQLKEKGVKSAKIASRDAPSTSFLLSGVDEKLGADVGKVAPGFAGSEFKTVDCPTN